MAEDIAKVLKIAGSKKRTQELQQLGLYVYGLHNAFEMMLVTYPDNSKSLFKLHAKVVRSAFSQVF